jgi:uncharacterized protein YheU (UPF0270 family)
MKRSGQGTLCSLQREGLAEPDARRGFPRTGAPGEPGIVSEAQGEQGNVEIDHRALSAEALRGLIEGFVGREGTDYGLHEKTLDEKVADVLRQLEAGKAQITFDFASQSVNIVPRRQR